MNKAIRYCSNFILLLLTGCQFSFAFEIPPRPNPPRLVNDLANMMNNDEVRRLEEKLVNYSDSTSNQIAIVTIEALEGNDMVQTAYRIGDSWGVGGKNQDNGIVILISKQDRNVWIATGKGMEGPVPDVSAKKIVDNIFIPNFRNGDYYKGLDEGTDVIIKLASGEFVDEIEDQSPGPMKLLPVIIIIIIILIIISRNNRGRGGKYISRRGTFGTPWIWGGGGFGGGGFGGGGGGGFGGFGGGSFGGGGAGGRW